MSPDQESVLNIVWLVVILGVVIWLFIRSVRRSDNRPKLMVKWVVTALLLWWVFAEAVPGFREGGLAAISALFLMLFCGGVLAAVWGHGITDALARPLSNIFDGGNEPPPPQPYYSVALAKRKQGLPLEALVETRRQLANFPNDFEGVLLLAGIQAEDLKDLPGAEITLDNFCDSSSAPPKQVAVALNQLADWQLKLAQNAGAARAALDRIIARFPDTELSLQAAQRIAHLGGTEKLMLAAQDRQPTIVPEGVKNVGLLQSSAHLSPAGEDPKKLAAEYVKHLEKHPLDTEIREKLAIIYADHYERLDLATGELKQLIEYPHQPAKHVVHWLNLLADLQVRHGADYDTVRQTLEKIVERFSGLAAAEVARTRLGRLKLEFKGHEKTPGVKLGEYEQNIGLKRGSLRREL